MLCIACTITHELAVLFIDLVPQLILGPERTCSIAPGSHHYIQCNVSRSSMLPNTTQLTITWLDNSNRTISDDRDHRLSISERMVNETVLSSKLTFYYMYTSQAGQYTCIVTMTIPQEVLSYSINSTLDVAVQCKYLN